MTWRNGAPSRTCSVQGSGICAGIGCSDGGHVPGVPDLFQDMTMTSMPQSMQQYGTAATPLMSSGEMIVQSSGRWHLRPVVEGGFDRHIYPGQLTN